MTTQTFKRKLAAILSADVKGFSRLMGDDEVSTINLLSSHFQFMTDLIQQHGGRVVNMAGDALLAEFASVVDAVQGAVEVQKALKVRNADLPENRRMEFRIGINLGDVIEKDDTIYGDGVNIAARVQSLAEAGGICISGSAFDQIEDKLPLRYDYLGEQAVKNIARPVRVYRTQIKPEGVARRPLEVASKEKMAFPLPDGPSIAVLPFVNMSEDPKQESLGDGITESIITALSKVPRLVVIARNSIFIYKGRPVRVKQVSEELGVRYVLEGSVQRAADRVRITAQMIDALTGNHLWEERYDRDVKDIFVLQDEITLKVLTATQVKLTEGERSPGYGKYFRGRQGLDCYLKIQEGYKYAILNIESNNMARRIAEEVLAMCPEVPMAYTLMAWVHANDYWLGSTKSRRESTEKGIEMAQKALSLDDTLAEAHSFLSAFYGQNREYDKSIAEAERAVALNPSGAWSIYIYAYSLVNTGRSKEALPLFHQAIRLNPHGPIQVYNNYGHALWLTGQFEEAVQQFKKVIQHVPNHSTAHAWLAITYIMLGREKEARDEAAEHLLINPNFTVDTFAKTSLYKDQSQKEKIVEALRKAGLK